MGKGKEGIKEEKGRPDFNWPSSDTAALSRIMAEATARSQAWLSQLMRLSQTRSQSLAVAEPAWLGDQRLPGGRRGQASGAAATQMSQPSLDRCLPPARPNSNIWLLLLPNSYSNVNTA